MSTVGISAFSGAIHAYREAILAGPNAAKPSGGHSSSGSSTIKPVAVPPAAAPAMNERTRAAAERVRRELDSLQSGIAKDLRAAMGRTGQALIGTVSFQVDSRGQMQISGNEKDKANVQKALAADKLVPTLTSRIKSLDKRLEAYDLANTRAVAMSSAARVTGPGLSRNVMNLYQTLVSQNSGSTAVLSVSARESGLAFAGALSVKA